MQTMFRMCANNVKEMHRPGSEFAVSRAVSVSGRVTATETLRVERMCANNGRIWRQRA